jgi:hypothetical protein
MAKAVVKTAPRTRRKKAEAKPTVVQGHGILETMARRLYVRRFPDAESFGDDNLSRSDIERLVAVHQNRHP